MFTRSAYFKRLSTYISKPKRLCTSTDGASITHSNHRDFSILRDFGYRTTEAEDKFRGCDEAKVSSWI